MFDLETAMNDAKKENDKLTDEETEKFLEDDTVMLACTKRLDDNQMIIKK